MATQNKPASSGTGEPSGPRNVYRVSPAQAWAVLTEGMTDDQVMTWAARAFAGKHCHRAEEGFVYAIECSRTHAVKIGWSASPESRLKALQTGAPFRLRLLAQFPGTLRDEHALRRRFKRHRLHGEWLAPKAREAVIGAFMERAR